jgi:peroxiredoxin
MAMHSTPKSSQLTTSSPCTKSPNDIENKMPNFEKSNKVSCFGTESEPLKNDGKWLQKYQLQTKVGKVSRAIVRKSSHGSYYLI